MPGKLDFGVPYICFEESQLGNYLDPPVAVATGVYCLLLIVY
jgi:hypothetical protein